MTDPFIIARLQRGAQHLHRLGAPAIAELLAEVGERIGGIPCIVSALAEYERRITPNMERTAGGDWLPRHLQTAPR
jgi:hypothetical protein